MKQKINLLVCAAALLFMTTANAQSLKLPAPSPGQTIKQNFGVSEITIDYSRPGAKNRVVYGDVVPFGKIWRTGANGATKITFADDVTVEGKSVKAGTYALYTMPNKDSWDMMLYKDLTLGGNVDGYKPEEELIRFTVKPTVMNDKVETFTINFADVTPTTTNIELAWEKTKVAFKVATEFDEKVMKNIETTMAMDKRPYHQAATYYLDNNKDLTKALAWENIAIEQNPKAYWMWHNKAKIQLKLKDVKGAIASAEQSMALAKADKDDAYVKNNEKLIAEAKATK
jgi:hypothetical protein